MFSAEADTLAPSATAMLAQAERRADESVCVSSLCVCARVPFVL